MNSSISLAIGKVSSAKETSTGMVNRHGAGDGRRIETTLTVELLPQGHQKKEVERCHSESALVFNPYIISADEVLRSRKNDRHNDDVIGHQQPSKDSTSLASTSNGPAAPRSEIVFNPYNISADEITRIRTKNRPDNNIGQQRLANEVWSRYEPYGMPMRRLEVIFNPYIISADEILRLRRKDRKDVIGQEQKLDPPAASIRPKQEANTKTALKSGSSHMITAETNKNTEMKKSQKTGSGVGRPKALGPKLQDTNKTKAKTLPRFTNHAA
jgi:hypothetical protein